MCASVNSSLLPVDKILPKNINRDKGLNSQFFLIKNIFQSSTKNSLLDKSLISNVQGSLLNIFTVLDRFFSDYFLPLARAPQSRNFPQRSSGGTFARQRAKMRTQWVTKIYGTNQKSVRTAICPTFLTSLYELQKMLKLFSSIILEP